MNVNGPATDPHTPAELRAALEELAGFYPDGDEIYRAAMLAGIAAMDRVAALEGPARRMARSIFADLRHYWPSTAPAWDGAGALASSYLREVIEDGRRVFVLRCALSELLCIWDQELPRGLILTEHDRATFAPRHVASFEAAVAALYAPAPADRSAA